MEKQCMTLLILIRINARDVYRKRKERGKKENKRRKKEKREKREKNFYIILYRKFNPVNPFNL